MRNWITVSKAFVVGVNPSKQKNIKLPTLPVVDQKETIQHHMNPDKQQIQVSSEKVSEEYVDCS